MPASPVGAAWPAACSPAALPASAAFPSPRTVGPQVDSQHQLGLVIQRQPEAEGVCQRLHCGEHSHQRPARQRRGSTTGGKQRSGARLLAGGTPVAGRGSNTWRGSGKGGVRGGTVVRAGRSSPELAPVPQERVIAARGWKLHDLEGLVGWVRIAQQQPARRCGGRVVGASQGKSNGGAARPCRGGGGPNWRSRHIGHLLPGTPLLGCPGASCRAGRQCWETPVRLADQTPQEKTHRAILQEKSPSMVQPSQCSRLNATSCEIGAPLALCTRLRTNTTASNAICAGLPGIWRLTLRRRHAAARWAGPAPAPAACGLPGACLSAAAWPRPGRPG